MKKIMLTIAVAFVTTMGFSQTEEELRGQLGAAKDSIAAIQGRADALQGQIDKLPGWKKGAFGTIGANISSFNNWYAQASPNNSTGNIGVTVNAFANLNQDKFYIINNLLKDRDKDMKNARNSLIKIFSIVIIVLFLSTSMTVFQAKTIPEKNDFYEIKNDNMVIYNNICE